MVAAISPIFLKFPAAAARLNEARNAAASLWASPDYTRYFLCSGSVTFGVRNAPIGVQWCTLRTAGLAGGAWLVGTDRDLRARRPRGRDCRRDFWTASAALPDALPDEDPDEPPVPAPLPPPAPAAWVSSPEENARKRPKHIAASRFMLTAEFSATGQISQIRGPSWADC